ncbi:uncharacterized protein EV422DRAFT_131634 [Fimicolochytrium jonesii]|uniref:uncharacterized protein n=1 Tax=Fimicolochytrium jonesii TaxID=1396493 RepID=UPI0022FF4537|nr:uncharacterized protein EV422DRAFT_131634 [Fimicolochytrium jonesii]KAI8825565.1 hypothetical protein EV422DRAFT_131634 [Fimicolochytrium jonesii]
MSVSAILTVTASEYGNRTGNVIDPAQANFDTVVFWFALDKLRRHRHWKLDGHVHFVYRGATSETPRPSMDNVILTPPTTVNLTGRHRAIFTAIRDPHIQEDCFLCHNSRSIPGWHAFDTMKAAETESQEEPAPATEVKPTLAVGFVRRMSETAVQDIIPVIQSIAGTPGAVASAVADTFRHPIGTLQEVQAAVQDILPVIQDIASSPLQVVTQAYDNVSATATRLGALRISATEPWSFLDDLVEDTGAEDPAESDNEFEDALPSAPNISADLQVLFTSLTTFIDHRLGRLRNDIGSLFEYVARGQILTRVQSIFGIETMNPEGVRVQGREFTWEDNMSSFRLLWTALTQKYQAQWGTNEIPVKSRPRSLEINFLYFCYHSGTPGKPIISPPTAVPRTPLDQDFEASRSVTGMSAIMKAVGKQEPNVVMVGELTTSELLLNNKATRRKLGQLERGRPCVP